MKGHAVNRQLGHVSFRYVGARTAEMLYRRTHPGTPWLTATAVGFLQGWLKSSDKIVEYGSGGSTAWFAQRGLQVVSVEHDREWYARVQEGLDRRELANVDFRLRLDEEDYVNAVADIDPASVDVVLVDGKWRGRCANEAVRIVKPAGLIVIDNANWYLPCTTRSPAAQALSDEAGWPIFRHSTADWRRFWTSNGVTDTAFFFAAPSS